MKKYKIMLMAALFLAAWAGATALGDLSATMQPGTWKILLTQGGFGTSFLETYTSCNANNHSILQYGNKAAWDPASRQFMFLGSPHGNPSKFVLYSDETNTWREGPLPSSCFNSGHTCGGCNVHSYYLSSIDAARGRFFFSSGSNIYAYNISANSWSSYASGQAHYTGLSWFPEQNAIIYCGNGDVLRKYSESSRSWSTVGNYDMYNIHNVCLYNPVHKCVVFGGGNGYRKLYRMDQNGQVTQLRDAPQEIRVCTSIMTVDPVSGKYLVLYNGNAFYEMDPVADTWTSITAPPVQVANAIGCGTGLVGTPVSTYGVNMFIAFSPPMVLVYKHTGGSAVAAPAPAAKAGLEVTASPNPFKAAVDITVYDGHIGATRRVAPTVSIYDPHGRMVHRADITQNGSYTWNASGLPAGVYILEANAGNATIQKKLFLLR
jgi:hypothetical protein